MTLFYGQSVLPIQECITHPFIYQDHFRPPTPTISNHLKMSVFNDSLNPVVPRWLRFIFVIAIQYCESMLEWKLEHSFHSYPSSIHYVNDINMFALALLELILITQHHLQFRGKYKYESLSKRSGAFFNPIEIAKLSRCSNEQNKAEWTEIFIARTNYIKQSHPLEYSCHRKILFLFW